MNAESVASFIQGFLRPSSSAAAPADGPTTERCRRWYESDMPIEGSGFFGLPGVESAGIGSLLVEEEIRPEDLVACTSRIHKGMQNLVSNSICSE